MRLKVASFPSPESLDELGSVSAGPLAATACAIKAENVRGQQVISNLPPLGFVRAQAVRAMRTTHANSHA